MHRVAALLRDSCVVLLRMLQHLTLYTPNPSHATSACVTLSSHLLLVTPAPPASFALSPPPPSHERRADKMPLPVAVPDG